MPNPQTQERRPDDENAVAVMWVTARTVASAKVREISDGLARNWPEVAAYSLLVALAAGMRLWDLGSRAMHHDESLHAYYSFNLASGLGYEHNPMMHGPFQFEATAAVFRIFGDGDYTARLFYALAGTVLVALPVLFRSRLGRRGALIVAALLAFSPSMLYFSRFARNDIIVAVWTLGLVICMWRFLDEGKPRYLYVAAALLGLAFATKETAYLITATLGLYLTAYIAANIWTAARPGLLLGRVSPPVAIWRLASGLWGSLTGDSRVPLGTRPAQFLMLLIAVTLPVWAAFASVFQETPLLNWSGLVLASPVGAAAPIGAPVAGGIVVAAYVLIALFVLSAYLGYRWNWSVWWRAAIIFYAVLLLTYTTFLTNPNGIGSGLWQSLGYWVVQQGEARGGQPWYYYFVITSVYEFLPLLFALAGAIYYLRRDDRFGQFLVFWAVTTFALYTVASEKMPWLLVNVSLPLIVLAGKFLADVTAGIQWRRLVSPEGLAVLTGVPVFVVALYTLAFFDAGTWGLSDVLLLVAAAAVVIALAVAGYWLARTLGRRRFTVYAALPVAAVLLVLSLRAGWMASYENGDTPVEMIVYTQTSPDIARLARQVEPRSASNEPIGVPVTIDGTSGFHWPWLWYLRHHGRVGYATYNGGAPGVPPDSQVVLVHSQNKTELDPVLQDAYAEGKRIKHRWWFPESYKGLTLAEFFASFVDRESWRTAMDYFLHRKIRTRLGSEDAWVFISKDSGLRFEPSL